tara:strand:- start:58 stop:936 length:879 start_codon:yes stop_codon:yes gene_type:complete
MYKHFKNKIRYFIELGRYNKLYGAFLLMWPCYWGSLINYQIDQISLKNLFLFFLGSIVMRGAGCTINDIIDAPLDAKVKRTKNRPLVSKKLTKVEAILFLIFQLFFGLIIILNFDLKTILISFFIIPFVFVYPFVKKISNYPQVFLGFVFNWGIIIAYFSLHQTIDLGCITLYLAGLFLTLGYDTIYAFQDIIDDTKNNIGSVAVKYQKYPRLIVTFFYATSILLFMTSFIYFQMNKVIMFSTLIVIFLHCCYQVMNIQIHKNTTLLKLFISNVGLGFIIFFGLLINSTYSF